MRSGCMHQVEPTTAIKKGISENCQTMIKLYLHVSIPFYLHLLSYLLLNSISFQKSFINPIPTPTLVGVLFKLISLVSKLL